MQLSDFDFHLPSELIAAFPPKERSSARLLAVDRGAGKYSHHIFRDLTAFLKRDDLLVLNNTKVIPARIFGKKESGGKVEALLLNELKEGEWETLLRPGGRIKKGMTLVFGEGDVKLEAEVLDDAIQDSGQRTLKFWDQEFRQKLAKIGHIPLPPYLDRPDTELDREMYQTVFAQKEGAVASPTAGLHFDSPLLEALKVQGVEIAYVTLHTGYGTFQPIGVEDLTQHKMFSERYEISETAAHQINQALAKGRRVIACGTTSVRALESAFEKAKGIDSTVKGQVKAGAGLTQLFIYPGFQFNVISAMITNFHLPKSSLLLLVAALMGKEKMFDVYREAISQSYRFYSYGDAMLIF